MDMSSCAGDTRPDIGICSFQYCLALKSVYIPSSVTTISDFAFWCCSGITDVSYGATEDQWSKVSVNIGNDAILSAVFTYGNEGITKVGIKFLTPIQKDAYAYGEDISFDGAVVAVMYSDGTYAEITDYTVSGYDKYLEFFQSLLAQGHLESNKGIFHKNTSQSIRFLRSFPTLGGEDTLKKSGCAGQPDFVLVNWRSSESGRS